NNERLFGSPNRPPYVKDGINNYVVHGRRDAVNPEKKGTKASAHYALTVEARGSKTLRLRLSDVALAGVTSAKKGQIGPFGSVFDNLMDSRRREAHEFYATVIPSALNADQTNVMRQALAGMMWSKQFYNYDVDKWLEERGSDPFKPQRRGPRQEPLQHTNHTTTTPKTGHRGAPRS